MQIIETIEAMRAARPALGRLGFVPTMGYLHAGHMRLVEQARAECEAVAVSIFVNPSQFGPLEDLSRYPRDLPRDLAMLEAAGVAAVFVPTVSEIYPADFATWVEVTGVTEPLEGERRPGHFRGVATVVCKLFNIVQAERAFFGQKDAQQTIAIRQMVRDLALPTKVVIVPTVREADGLAMSSRNVYLDPAQRAAAPVLYRALTAAQAAWQQGERTPQVLRDLMRSLIEAEPLARIDYVSVADPRTMAELDLITNDALLSLAVRFGTTRLIDNILLDG